MGARASRPTEEQASHLRSNFDRQCRLAASALNDADVLILVTGAGFSADSGLAVYNDVAEVDAYRELGLTYRDLCQPHWLRDWPEVFYGFWGQCFDDYRDTGPHVGYDIVARWRDDKNNTDDSDGSDGGGGVSSSMAKEMRGRVRVLEAARRANEEALLLRRRKRKSDKLNSDEGDGDGDGDGSDSSSSDDDSEMDIMEIDAALNGGTRDEPYSVTGRAGAFFTFTSNVDAHSYDTFQAHEIRECHGNVELWQCGRGQFCPGGSRIWRAPLNFRFEVDPETMLAPAERTVVTADDDDDPKNEEPAKTADDPKIDSSANATTDEAESSSSSSSSATSSLDAMREPPGVDGDEDRAADEKDDSAATVAVPAPERAHVGHTLGGSRPHTLRYMLDKEKTPTPSSPSSSSSSTSSNDDGSIDGDGVDRPRSRVGWTTNGRTGNYPLCPRCGSPARPAVLMFDDSNWVDDESQSERWNLWKAALYDACLERAEALHARAAGSFAGEEEDCELPPPPPPVKVCIVEVGCGDNVATCRRQSEHVTREVIERGGDATLVRVNPDFPLADDTDDQALGLNVISVMARGLETLRRIDHHYGILRGRGQRREQQKRSTTTKRRLVVEDEAGSGDNTMNGSTIRDCGR